MGAAWDLLLCPAEEGFDSGIQTRSVVKQFVKTGLGLDAVISTGRERGRVSERTVSEGVDENGEGGGGGGGGVRRNKGGLVDIDTSAGTSGVEDDIEFGSCWGPEGGKSKKVKEEEEEEEEAEEDEGGSEAAIGGGGGGGGGGVVVGGQIERPVLVLVLGRGKDVEGGLIRREILEGRRESQIGLARKGIRRRRRRRTRRWSRISSIVVRLGLGIPR